MRRVVLLVVACMLITLVGVYMAVGGMGTPPVTSRPDRYRGKNPRDILDVRYTYEYVTTQKGWPQWGIKGAYVLRPGSSQTLGLARGDVYIILGDDGKIADIQVVREPVASVAHGGVAEAYPDFFVDYGPRWTPCSTEPECPGCKPTPECLSPKRPAPRQPRRSGVGR